MNDDLNATICELSEKVNRLTQENHRLKQLIILHNIEDSANSTPLNANTEQLSAEDKIRLFRSLFRGREDVYAKRWQAKNGNTGYSPSCVNEWKKPLCQKPKIKCNECQNRKLLPVTDKLIYDHLKGNVFIGIYPLLEDESCYFLTMDFDKKNWREDAKAITEICQQYKIPHALELSQSGDGIHIWIFFSEPIPAYLARKLGSAILTQAMQKRHQISLTSYDRLFPNQDTMPKGGFGNLIAVPLQGLRRKENKTVFLDNNLIPLEDQWNFLRNIKKLSLQAVLILTKQFVAHGGIIDVRRTQTDGDDVDPWVSNEITTQTSKINEPLPDTVNVVLANLIYIETTKLPSKLINILKKLAAFQNPEFYKAQAMRLPTYNKPRVIGCAEEFPRYIGLPRGCLKDIVSILKVYNITSKLIDKTCSGSEIEISFIGELQPKQKTAIAALQQKNYGILAATTGFGKTVVAIKMIAARKVNTLILVHRQQLMDQWRERLIMFLNINKAYIGIIGGGKKKPAGKIDIAMLQSVVKKEQVDNIVSQYGHVIVDECHHISAFSFERVLRQVKAKYVLGLTATPIRKDGHHPIILMQCGSIVFRTKTKDSIKQAKFSHVVKFRHTNLQQELLKTMQINDIYATMIENKKRNELIFNDVLLSLEEKRSPLLLTERTQHLEFLENKLKPFVKNLFVLRGGLGKKQREKIYRQIAELPDNEERLIIATGRYIGEGFDDARLDTLFLTMPISWQGTLQQYIGRLHRSHDNKRNVIVYDYVDSYIPALERMYRKRLKKYKAIGYEITNF